MIICAKWERERKREKGKGRKEKGKIVRANLCVCPHPKVEKHKKAHFRLSGSGL
jgi:hypothetical protein